MTKKKRASDIVVVARAENTGLGSLSEDFCRNMSADAILVNANKPRRIYRDRLDSIVGEVDLSKGPLDQKAVSKMIEGYKAIVFFETFYDAAFLIMADTLGVKTIGFPMWEWSPPHFDMCKALIALSEPDIQTYPQAVRMNWPIDTAVLQPAPSPGMPPKRFLHNYGYMGVNYRNGTRAVLTSSFTLFGSGGAKLLVRGNEGFPAEWGNAFGLFDPQVIEWKQPTESRLGLFSDADCLVLAPRFEGLYLAILEATALGIPVITSDLPCFRHYPHRVPVKEAGSFIANNGTEVPLYDPDAESLGEMMLEMSRGNIPMRLPDERYRPPTWEQFAPAFRRLI